MQQGPGHALAAAAGLNIDGGQLRVLPPAEEDRLADEPGVPVQPQGDEMRHMHHLHQGVPVPGDQLVHLQPGQQGLLLLPGVQGRGGHGAAHGDAPVAEGNLQRHHHVALADVETVLQIELPALGILGIQVGIQAGPQLRVHVLQHPGPGHHRAEEQIPGGLVPLDGEIQVHRAVRIQAGLQLIKNIGIARLGPQIVDGVENVLRIDIVHGLLRMQDIHEGRSFLTVSFPREKQNPPAKNHYIRMSGFCQNAPPGPAFPEAGRLFRRKMPPNPAGSSAKLANRAECWYNMPCYWVRGRPRNIWRSVKVWRSILCLRLR